MKKLFRRSLACIIAVMMIATSLPFSAITANADTTANSSITMNAFGAFRNGTAQRVGTDYISVCNDGKSSNFVMAVFKFNISGLIVDDSMTISAKFKYYLQLTESENKGVSFYYPTKNLDEFNIVNKYQGQPNSSIWTTDDGKHLSRAIDYYGLQALATNISISNTKSTGDLEIERSIMESRKQGKSYAVVVGVIASAGQSDKTGGWTDTKIGYESTNVDVAVTTSERNYTFAEVQSALASFSAYYPSAYGSFTGDDSYTNYSDHYKGLLYAEDVWDYSATGLVQLGSGATGTNTCYANLYFPTSVALSSGSNEITVPIMISASVARSGFWGCKFRGQSGVIVGSGLSLVNSEWNGKDEKDGGSENCYANGNQKTNLPAMNFMWTINQTTYKLSTNGTTSPTNSNIDPGYGQKAEIWANKVKVTPTFSDNTKVTYFDYYPEINFYVSSSDEGFNPSKVIKFQSTDYVRVVNYKPYLDKLANVKSDIAKMNGENYTTETLSAYVKACSRFLNLNPSLYTYSKDSATASTNLIADLNSAMSAYDTAKANLKYNYVFKRINGKVLGTIPAKTYSEALTATAAYFYDPSPATAKTPDGAGNHTWTTYAWPDTVAEGVYEIVEVATPHSEKCTNDGTGKCSVCGGSLLDKTALNGAKAQAETILNAGNADGKYVADTYQNLFDVYNRIKDVVPTTQDQVNSLTSELLTAISSLISSSVKITFTKSQNGTPVGDAQVIPAKYGDTVKLTVDDGDVEKWEIVNNKGAENEVRTFVKTGQNTLSIVVSKDISVIAHLAENVSSQHKITKVVFMGRNNAVVAIKYIEPYDTFETRNVPIPAIPFYEENGWDKTEVVGLENGGEITVRAKYTFNGQEADKCGIHYYDGSEYKVRKYNYDSFVKLNGLSTYYGMYEDEARTKLLTYFKTDEFYAPHNSNIYVAPVDASAVTASVGVTGSYQENYDTKDVAAFNCKFFVPDNAQIVEWGIKANAGGTVYNFKSNNKTSRNEYTFKVNVEKAANISSVKAKAYIIYIDGKGNRITLLSNNEVAINFN